MLIQKLFSVTKKCFATTLAKAFLIILIASPVTVQSQDAGCINTTTIYVNIGASPPTITASLPSFGNCGTNYTYQWQVSTDDKYFADIPGATGQYLSYTEPVTATLYFLRKATCNTVTKYTNSVTVVPSESVAYARFEVSNSSSSSTTNPYNDGTEYEYFQNVSIYIRFYSDAACTQPYVLPSNVSYSINNSGYYETESSYYYHGSAVAYQGTALAGTSEVFIDDIISFEWFWGITDSNEEWITYEKYKDDYELSSLGGAFAIATPIYPSHSGGY